MDVIGKAASAGEETLDAGGYRGDLSVRVCAGIFPRDDALTRSACSFEQIERRPYILAFLILAGSANKQPNAVVITGTAAAQSPSIAASSIGSRSRSKQRS